MTKNRYAQRRIRLLALLLACMTTVPAAAGTLSSSPTSAAEKTIPSVTVAPEASVVVFDEVPIRIARPIGALRTIQALIRERALAASDKETSENEASDSEKTDKKDSKTEAPAMPIGFEARATATPFPLTLADRLDQSGCPDEIREFVEKYPEAEPFALNYRNYSTYDEAIEISQELTPGEIPLFIQWDPRWGYRDYGGNFLGINGCGPTCLSMVYTGQTGDDTYDPYHMAVWAQERGYYQSGVGTAWELMSYGAGELGLKSYSLTVSESAVREALEKGHPVICSVGPGDFTQVGHFIILTAIDAAGKISIRDPNSPVRSAQSWTLEEILKQTRKLWAFEIPDEPQKDHLKTDPRRRP